MIELKLTKEQCDILVALTKEAEEEAAFRRKLADELEKGFANTPLDYESSAEITQAKTAAIATILCLFFEDPITNDPLVMSSMHVGSNDDGSYSLVAINPKTRTSWRHTIKTEEV